MTPEQINIAIAEECGWKRGAFASPDYGPSPDVFVENAWTAPNGEVKRTPPNYCSDLNAMREAWLTFPPEFMVRFAANLYEIVKAQFGERWNGFHESYRTARVIGATAQQWAEAFLRTVGKWKEGV